MCMCLYEIAKWKYFSLRQSPYPVLKVQIKDSVLSKPVNSTLDPWQDLWHPGC